MQKQLRWAGHCVKMSNNRSPHRQVFSAQLPHGTRKHGGQRKRSKDTAKHYIKIGQIDNNAWEIMAEDSPL